MDLKQKFNKLKQKTSRNIEEILLFTGLFFILYATYYINYIAFLYTLGFILCSFSIFLLKFRGK